jgi:hypothetical protein
VGTALLGALGAKIISGLPQGGAGNQPKDARLSSPLRDGAKADGGKAVPARRRPKVQTNHQLRRHKAKAPAGGNSAEARVPDGRADKPRP